MSLRAIFSSKDIRNLFCLATIQFSNALLPLIAFPAVMLSIGVEQFSSIAITEAVATLLLAITLYSFEIDGVSSVVGLSVVEDREQISRVFSEILYARLLIVATCALGVLAVLPLLETRYQVLMLGWLLYPIGVALQSLWLFQALERNVVPAFVVAVTRTASLFGLLVYVDESTDYWLVPILFSLSYFMSGLILQVVLWRKLRINLLMVPMHNILQRIRSGTAIFIGGMSVSLYRDSNTLILGALSTSHAVSVYAVVEKIVKFIQAAARPINQLYFNKVIIALEGRDTPDRHSLRVIVGYTLPQLFLMLICLLLFYVTAYNFLPLLSGAGLIDSIYSGIPILIFMSVAVFVGISNFMLGSVGLNCLGQRHYFLRAILTVGLVSISVSAVLSLLYGAWGAAIIFVLSEVALLVLVVKRYTRGTAE